jgi:hypothetical protein
MEDIVQKTRRQEIFGVKEVMMFTQVCQLLECVFWGRFRTPSPRVVTRILMATSRNCPKLQMTLGKDGKV